MKSVKKEKLEFVMPFEAKKYDNAPTELIEAFKNVDISNLTDITLGGNSYDSESCKWIKENVLLKAPFLTKVNFSNMFVSRLRADLPTSIKYLFEGLNMNNLVWADLSDNALGPEIKAIEK
jgi:Ran GTPase-activating protein (RanGAP) involved in mRNA processing and transport